MQKLLSRASFIHFVRFMSQHVISYSVPVHTLEYSRNSRYQRTLRIARKKIHIPISGDSLDEVASGFFSTQGCVGILSEDSNTLGLLTKVATFSTKPDDIQQFIDMQNHCNNFIMDFTSENSKSSLMQIMNEKPFRSDKSFIVLVNSEVDLKSLSGVFRSYNKALFVTKNSIGNVSLALTLTVIILSARDDTVNFHSHFRKFGRGEIQ